MKFFIRILRNTIPYDIQPEIDAFAAWIRRFTPLEPVITIVDSALPLKFKDFGVQITGGDFGDSPTTAWGLEGIKQQLRDANIAPWGEASATIFLYDLPQLVPNQLAAWTYPQDLSGSAFTEVPVSSNYPEGNLCRILTHEICHAFHRLCWFSGKTTADTMDLYDLEFSPDSGIGNRARNLENVSPYWTVIAQSPKSRLSDKLESLKATLVGLLKFFTHPMPKIEAWAQAIKKHEGWFPGSRSFRNHNPGNLKFTPYVQKELRAVGADQGNFAIFGTDEMGMHALEVFLRQAAQGQLKAYWPDMTLIEFFSVYAPSSDQNDPNGYALFAAHEIGVDPQTKIKTLI